MVVLSFTFDDGNLSQISDFYPIMKKYAFPATFYVVAADIGLPGKLTAQNLRDLAEEGNEIGSHGWTHRSLPRLRNTELRNELERSLEVLSEFDVKTFSYPYGHFNERVASEVARYYESARGYCVAIAPNRASSLDRYALYSFPVEGKFQSRINPQAAEYLPRQENTESNCWFIITLHGKISISAGIRSMPHRMDTHRLNAYVNYIRSRLSRTYNRMPAHFEDFCQDLVREKITVATISEGLEQLSRAG